MASPTQALRRLELDGLIQLENGELRTTRRWQGAMARAALQLYRAGEKSADLRLPIVCALVELYGSEETAEVLADLTEAMLPIEARALDPRATCEPASPTPRTQHR